MDGNNDGGIRCNDYTNQEIRVSNYCKHESVKLNYDDEKNSNHNAQNILPQILQPNTLPYVPGLSIYDDADSAKPSWKPGQLHRNVSMLQLLSYVTPAKIHSVEVI